MSALKVQEAQDSVRWKGGRGQSLAFSGEANRSILFGLTKGFCDTFDLKSAWIAKGPRELKEVSELSPQKHSTRKKVTRSNDQKLSRS